MLFQSNYDSGIDALYSIQLESRILSQEISPIAFIHCRTGEVFVQQPDSRDIIEWNPVIDVAITHNINGHILQIQDSKKGALIALQPFINKIV